MIQLTPLDRWNWEDYTKITLAEAQLSFVPSVLHALAQANFEALTPLGITKDNTPVGFAMYGDFGGICWINRFLVDVRYQQQGIGTQALKLLLSHLQTHQNCKEIRTSVAKNNRIALTFFTKAGFSPINEALSDEIVLRLM